MSNDIATRQHLNRIPPGCDLLTLAINVRRRRIFLGFTQKQLAEKASISLTTVQHIEVGKVVPQVATVKLLANVLSNGDVSKLWRYEILG